MTIFVIAVFPPFKAPEADHAYHLCRNLADAGMNVSVVTQHDGSVLDHINTTVYPIMREWSWREMPRLARLLKRVKPDAILLYFIGYIYKHHPMITFAPTLARWMCPKVPFVTIISHVFGSSSADSGLPSRLLHKAIRSALGENVDYNFGTILRDSDKLIMLSERHIDLMSGLLPFFAEKCIIIPPPPIMTLTPESPEKAKLIGREALCVAEDEFLLAYFGYIYPPKGIETLLQAFSKVSQARGNIRLALIGGDQRHTIRPNYAQEMRDLTKELGLEDKVVFTGSFPWDSPQASNYLYAADACVLPFDEGVHLNNSSFAAAVTHGLPVITTQGSTLERPFLNRENVLLCSPSSPEALAAAIGNLMDDGVLRQRLHRGSLKLASEWFSWKNATRRIIAVLSPHAHSL